MQYSQEQDYLFRILFSSAKCLTEQVDKGSRYSDVSKIISVSILYFDFCAGDDYIYHGTTEFYGLHNQHKLELNPEQKQLFDCEKVADIFPEHYIINIRNFNDIAKDPLDQWIYFLKNEEVKEEFHAKGLLEAKEKLDILKLTATEKAQYEQYINELRREASLYQSSYELGELKGKEQERLAQESLRHQEKIEQAKMMNKNGLSIEQIALFTKLAVAEIESIFSNVSQ